MEGSFSETIPTTDLSSTCLWPSQFASEPCFLTRIVTVKSLLVTIVLLAGGIVGYFYWQHTKYPVSIDEPKVDLIKKSTIEDKITGSGKLELKGGLYYVVAEAAGKIEKVTPDLHVGKHVKKGELFLKLDSSIAQNKVSEAEAAVKTAQANIKLAEASKVEKTARINGFEKDLDFNRTKLERAEKNVANLGEAIVREHRKELEKAEAMVKASYALKDEAEANITLALANAQRAEDGLILARRGLESMTITAPCDGIILEVNKLVKDGQPISAGAVNGAPLFIVAPGLDEWEIKAQISEQDIGKLQSKLKAFTPEQIRSGSGVPVRFTVDAYSAEKIKFNGRVLRIDPLPAVNQRSGLGGLEALVALGGGGSSGASSGPASYNVIITVDPIDEGIRKTHPLFVGYTASDLQIIVQNFNDIVTIPSPALSFTPEGLNENQQKELRKNEEEGWSAVWFWSDGKYFPRYIKAGASEEGRTHVKEVLSGKPEDLLGKAAVTDGPKKPEKGGLFGGGPIKMPG